MSLDTIDETPGDGGCRGRIQYGAIFDETTWDDGWSYLGRTPVRILALYTLDDCLYAAVCYKDKPILAWKPVTSLQRVMWTSYGVMSNESTREQVLLVDTPYYIVASEKELEEGVELCSIDSLREAREACETSIDIPLNTYKLLKLED